VVSVFLIPQKLPKEAYVATTVLIFTWVNWIKVPFFVFKSLITRPTLQISLLYLALVPIGVCLGVWLNRKFSEAQFIKLVYLFTFLAGLELILHQQLAKWLR
jgi:hypothetical protein